MSFWKFQPTDPNSKVLDAVTTGTSRAVPYNNYEKVHALVVFSTGVSAGDVIIETAHDPNYAGLWNPIGTPSPVTFTANAAKGVVADFPPGGWVRARVGTTIVGGTVTVFLNAFGNES